ncbi:tetratricopeptide repeat protein [candidate division WOR-3 bacterium]|uniref:Tetratricopeptide repeat protein n=1 Tax=candidate division WOR-3 bacterium TaxID=2052148 RepID=A0A9D5KAS9_UNCW3|nr:tetratricopeptide repeat protein [candidate division WOR-3 bacterium]MBD3365688.1 tetratricopeptide repeat protein [candidate division WOR-3 bacterium]
MRRSWLHSTGGYMIGIILAFLAQTDEASIGFQVKASRDIEPMPHACIYYSVPSWLTSYDIIFSTEGVISTVNRDLYDAINASPGVLFHDSHLTLEDLVSFYKGTQFFFNSDYKQASGHFRKLTRVYVRESITDFANYYIGAIAFDQGNYQQCVRTMENITLTKNDLLASKVYFIEAQAYLELGRPDSALIAFKQARSIERNSMIDLYSTYALYRIHHSAGRLKERDREAARLVEIKLAEDDAPVTENLAVLMQGNVKFLEGKYQSALDFYNQIIKPLFDENTSAEELLVYEAAVTMSCLAMIRKGRYSQARKKAQTYLQDFDINEDSQLKGETGEISAGYGRRLRAYLLFNLAAATYFDSYDNEGGIVNTARRNEAERLFTLVTDTYPEAEIAGLAWDAVAWYKLEAFDFEDSEKGFVDVYTQSSSKDAQVLASYGRALSAFYLNDYASAYRWFLDEGEYEDRLSVTIDSTTYSRGLNYNAIAADIADEALFGKAKSAEMLGRTSQALTLYTRIPEKYPQRPTAGEAWQDITRIKLDRGDLEGAIAAVNNLKFMKVRAPEIYLCPYTFAVAMLYDYYMNVLEDENTAEEYAKTLLRETGNTEIIERLFYTQAMRYTDLEDIDILKVKIERLRNQNFRSPYLIAPLYNLSLMYYQANEYEKAEEILEDLVFWEDSSALGVIEPDIRFRLAVVNFRMKNYSKAARVLEEWTEDYSEGSRAREDLSPPVYWYLGYSFYHMAEMNKHQSVKTRAGYYRKAKRYFEHLAIRYSQTDFYTSEVDERVKRLITYCGEMVDELLKP